LNGVKIQSVYYVVDIPLELLFDFLFGFVGGIGDIFV
jgi:hypothetical protein